MLRNHKLGFIVSSVLAKYLKAKTIGIRSKVALSFLGCSFLQKYLKVKRLSFIGKFPYAVVNFKTFWIFFTLIISEVYFKTFCSKSFKQSNSKHNFLIKLPLLSKKHLKGYFLQILRLLNSCSNSDIILILGGLQVRNFR